MTYITIDFSLNSPGICIFKDKYHFISYLKPKSGTKKEQRIQEDMALLSDVVLKEQPDFTNVGAYSSVELGKINRYITSANDIIDIIKEFTKGETQFVFAFEGTSFGSKQGTNNIIDMAAGAAILKLKILEEFNPITIESRSALVPIRLKVRLSKGIKNLVYAKSTNIEMCVGNIPDILAKPAIVLIAASVAPVSEEVEAEEVLTPKIFWDAAPNIIYICFSDNIIV